MTKILDLIAQLIELVRGDPEADRAVPPSGFTAWLVVFTSGAMAFLGVFALSLTIATGRLAERWGGELAQSSTIKISAPADQAEKQVEAALAVLATTQGVTSARALDLQEQRDLLSPWFGPDLPIDSLPIPRLITVQESNRGFDIEGLRLRLRAEVPGAVLDDHTRWRKPLIRAANRLNLLGTTALALIAAAMVAMVVMATNVALSANSSVISVLRTVGARDYYIARAFVRRFTLRALSGAAIGAVVAMLGLALLPSADPAGGFLTGLGFTGFGWLLPLLVPPFVAVAAFWATRSAALRALEKTT